MRRRSWIIAVTTAVLSFGAAACAASGIPTSVPDTALAARSADLIDRAVRALVAREGESRITRLWVFPTGDSNTVFVHYRTTSDVDAHEPGPTTEHLVMLEMTGERIASLHDLTTAPTTVVASVSSQTARTAEASAKE
jgi:hypothetical protein